MKRKLHTLPCSSADDIRKFFDASAPEYKEQHGDAEKLFQYRMNLILQYAQLTIDDVLLDLGCGTGNHLLALAAHIRKGIGIDFSPKMIEMAQDNLRKHPEINNIHFQMEDAQSLSTIPDQSIDIALAVGSFRTHATKKQVIQHLFRVLKTNGRIAISYPNGNFLWYRCIAPLFHIETRHLSSDEFVTVEQMVKILGETGFTHTDFAFWTFIPRGDMNWGWATVLRLLDWIGKFLWAPYLRSGLIIRATKST